MTNKPPAGGEPRDRGRREYFPVEFETPVQQQGFIVTRQQWNRIKERVRNIRSRESHWISALYALLSIGVSFLIGALSLAQLEGVAIWVTVGFWMAVAIGIGGAIICLIAYMGIRGRRQDDIKVVIEYMDDIERLYER